MNIMETPISEQIITPLEVGEMLGIHERTVRNMLRRGEIPGRQIGKQWRCLRSAIYNMIPQDVPSAP